MPHSYPRNVEQGHAFSFSIFFFLSVFCSVHIAFVVRAVCIYKCVCVCIYMYTHCNSCARPPRILKAMHSPSLASERRKGKEQVINPSSYSQDMWEDT